MLPNEVAYRDVRDLIGVENNFRPTLEDLKAGRRVSPPLSFPFPKFLSFFFNLKDFGVKIVGGGPLNPKISAILNKSQGSSKRKEFFFHFILSHIS